MNFILNLFGKTQKNFIIDFLQSISVLVSANSDAVKYTGAESQQFLVSRSFLIESTDEKNDKEKG